jgi:23S rRNA (uracil1939-C5)-methyltransferase
VVNRLSEAPGIALAPGTVVEMDVTDLLANGQGVGRVSGMVIFVWGPLPGERARVRITLVKAKYVVADLVELLSVSADRVEPFCPVFGDCGGCQVQHLAYAAQLDWKRAIIESALRRIGGIREATVAVPIGMARPRAYRNKMALVARRRAAGEEFGFYQARSHDIVPVRACPTAHPKLDATIGNLWDAAREPRTAQAFAGARHVVARVGAASGESVVSITTDRASATLPAVADALRAALPGTAGIANSYDPASANAVLGRRHVLLSGSAEVEDEIGGVRFRVSAASFFQINPEIVAEIFRFIAPAVGAGSRIVDLYCGPGTFSLFFARSGARVLGIEENASAVREARANAERNGLAKLTSFIAGRVEQAVQGAAAAETAAATVVFLDPPRKGSDEATLAAIAAARVPQVWYLSCNPATLARDLAQLVAAGYVLDAVQPFDMFPQTGHVEALAALRMPDAAPAPFVRVEGQ